MHTRKISRRRPLRAADPTDAWMDWLGVLLGVILGASAIGVIVQYFQDTMSTSKSLSKSR